MIFGFPLRASGYGIAEGFCVNPRLTMNSFRKRSKQAVWSGRNSGMITWEDAVASHDKSRKVVARGVSLSVIMIWSTFI